MDPEVKTICKFVGWLIALAVLAIWGICWGVKVYDVWAQGKAGEAEFARAEANRKIRVLEAQAHQEAASSLAQAEIVRARGVAEANKIIGDSLKGNEAYLRYLWIHSLETTHDKVIYVPTEAGLPILEAGKR